MSKLSGNIEDTSTRQGTSKNGKPWTAYSAKINGTWYSLGFDRPQANKGDYVSFDAEEDKNGYMSAKNITKAAPPVSAQSGGSGTGVPATGDRNASIVYQSSRKDALALIQLLISQDALPISAAKTAAGKSKRYEEMLALVDKITVQYFYDVQSMRILDRVEDAGAEAKAPDSLPEDEQEGEPEADPIDDKASW